MEKRNRVRLKNYRTIEKLIYHFDTIVALKADEMLALNHNRSEQVEEEEEEEV